MHECYFTFHSITGAQRGETALLRQGLRSRLLRAPKFLAVRGCGYALAVPCSQLSAAAEALAIWQVSYEGAFHKTPHGVEEVRF